MCSKLHVRSLVKKKIDNRVPFNFQEIYIKKVFHKRDLCKNEFVWSITPQCYPQTTYFGPGGSLLQK